ncbi:MAG: IS5 family transposase [Dehalococcoidia bacterium]|nr:IS5 family transposase [Dehalococcoidia bacterium]
MRGKADAQVTMLSLVTADQLVPEDHPIRQIKPIVDNALRELSPTFSRMYAETGRPSIPPEHLLKACLLIALYSVRSERQFCERLQYDLLFKWFLDLNIIDPAFDASTFSKNKERLLEHDVAREFLVVVLEEARRRRLLSEDHFTVDGTLLEAWASLKSFRPKDAGNDTPTTGEKNPSVDFHGEQRTNDTHQSTTDPEAWLARKGRGKEAKLCFAGHVLMENRNGMVVDVTFTQATGTAERDAALDMLEGVPVSRRITVGADKGYDTQDFVTMCRRMNITPHVARRQTSKVDGRTTRHTGYQASQRIRKRVEEIFGWVKTVGGGRKLRYKGLVRNRLWWELTAVAYNLVRMAKLALAMPAGGELCLIN